MSVAPKYRGMIRVDKTALNPSSGEITRQRIPRPLSPSLRTHAHPAATVTPSHPCSTWGFHEFRTSPAGGTSKLRLGPMGEAVEAVLSISTENFIQVPNSDRDWKEVRKRS
jgi:hypothetical protein